MLEAILVALLVLTAILFVTSLQRPLQSNEAGGVDLARLSAQSLMLLQRQSFPDPEDVNSRLAVQEWVNRTMSGDPDVAALVEDYLTKVLPTGTRHSLSLTNGVGTLRLVPTLDPGLPRNARAAEVPFFPNWTEFRDEADDVVNATWARPGQAVGAGHPVLLAFTSATVQCIQSPLGTETGPGGKPWVEYWQAEAGRVPAGIPYGVWAGYTEEDCETGASFGRVALSEEFMTDYPIYGLRLVVWFGA